MKKALLPFLLILVMFFSSCRVGGGPEDSASSQTTGEEPSFSSVFDAKKALSALMELPYPAFLYSKDTLRDYNSLIAEISRALPGLDTIEKIERYIKKLKDAVKAAALDTGGANRVYIFADDEINDDYMPAQIYVISADGVEYAKKTGADIKLRGNSTRGADKRPYTIKFYEQVSLLGMEGSKKWVLLANAYDPTSLRNRMAFDLCLGLNFSYSPDSRFAEVYLNGQYRGLYLLCEAVNEGANRVDIDVGGGDYLFEQESDRTEEGLTYIATLMGMRLKLREPANISASRRMKLADFLRDAETAVNEGDYDEFSKYFDIKSFIDFYIFMELFKDVDGWYSSLYFYIKDGVIYAGPVWDKDLCAGNASKDVDEDKYRDYCNVPGFGNGSGDSAEGVWMRFGWFEGLLQNQRFRAETAERYNNLQPTIKNLYADNELGQNRIDLLIEQNKNSIERNNAMWDVSLPYTIYEMAPLATYEDNVEYLRSWLQRRNAFLCEYFSSLQ